MPPSQLVVAWSSNDGSRLIRSLTQIAAAAFSSRSS